jgi:alpha-tubulin suppressor-like RCC1 family protein
MKMNAKQSFSRWMKHRLFWGRNIAAVTGVLLPVLGCAVQAAPYVWGNGSTRPVAVDISGALLGKSETAIATGNAHTVTLTSDGKVFAWGANGEGQLGDGTTINRTTPVAVNMSRALLGKTVTAIAAGADYTVALTSDGKVFAWGANWAGQLGDGTTINRTTPVAVDMSGALLGKTVTAIAAAVHTVALTSDGKVFAWGLNDYGQLGNGTTASYSTTPVAVDMSGALLGKTVTAIAAGARHTVALTSDGKVFAWGANWAGQLGDGTIINRTTPVAVDMSRALFGKRVTAIAAGFGHTVALAITPRLSNISSRAFVQTGDNVMIGGFIVQGTEPKRVILRAIGPSLTQYGVPNVLANPTLELHDGTGALIASNNNWATTIIGGVITANQVRDIQASGYAPGDGRESAIIADLAPFANYSAIVRGVNNMTGVGLVEVYDLSPESNSILGNISTRSFVQTGDNVMVGGFIVTGTKKVIVRATGPDLTRYGVPNVLPDPTLELHDSTGALIASNNNWATTIIGGIITTNQVHEIQASGYVPGDGLESAIIAELPAGNYTAIVRGVNDTTGIALVEVYDLD